MDQIKLKQVYDCEQCTVRSPATDPALACPACGSFDFEIVEVGPTDNTLHFSGSDFYVAESELSIELFSALEMCGRSGDQTEHVAMVREEFSITGDVDDCRRYLAGYGAWDDTGLADHTVNLDRLIWLAGGQLSDGENEIYFSRY